MTFHFGQLIAHIAQDAQRARRQHRRQRHGQQQGLVARLLCIAEKRAIETIEGGAPKTEFMKFGDTIRIEMKGADGRSVFGAIEQRVASPARNR